MYFQKNIKFTFLRKIWHYIIMFMATMLSISFDSNGGLWQIFAVVHIVFFLFSRLTLKLRYSGLFMICIFFLEESYSGGFYGANALSYLTSLYLFRYISKLNFIKAFRLFANHSMLLQSLSIILYITISEIFATLLFNHSLHILVQCSQIIFSIILLHYFNKVYINSRHKKQQKYKSLL